MPKFAQIIENRVHWIFEAETNPYLDPALVIIDITNIDPQPQENWRYIDGQFIQDAAPAPEPVQTRQPDIEEIRKQFKDQVSVDAGKLRAAIMTNVPGQEITYLMKLDDARRYLAVQAVSGSIDPSQYPWIYYEALHTSQSMDSVVQLVTYLFQAWTMMGSQIEGIRRGAIEELNTAATIDELRAIMASIQWPAIPEGI